MTKSGWLLLLASFFAACTGGLDAEEVNGRQVTDLDVIGTTPNPGSQQIPIGADVMVVNSSSGVACRTAPGADYLAKAVLGNGYLMKVLAVNNDRTYYYIGDSSIQCWMFHYYLTEVEVGDTPETTTPENPDTTSCHSGNLFDSSYCSVSCPCTYGEGHCDADYECESGLVCGTANGPNFGTHISVNVCVTEEENQNDQTPVSNPAGFDGMTSNYVLSRKGIINASAAMVGFSYWWGGAALPLPWETAGKPAGTCSLSNSIYTHTGSWGADCSGFVGDVWQLPEHKSFEANIHAFSTYNFYYERTHWIKLDRNSTQEGDALVYRGSTGGHIVIYAGADPWGTTQTYEARGCSYGVVYNARTFGSEYIAIGRKDLL